MSQICFIKVRVAEGLSSRAHLKLGPVSCRGATGPLTSVVQTSYFILKVYISEFGGLQGTVKNAAEWQAGAAFCRLRCQKIPTACSPPSGNCSMNSALMLNFTEKVAIFRESVCFNGLSQDIIFELAGKSHGLCFPKGETIFQAYDTKIYFYLVASGLVRVSICSKTGHRLTYLLAVRGDPLNLVGVFSNKPRLIEAIALQNSEILRLSRSDFMALSEKYHSIIPRIITVLGNAVDSANSRILDMVGKTVDQRMQRILRTLYLKFGPELKFTSTEIAEMICTTTESSIRALSKLRRRGVIQTHRGKIAIVRPEALMSSDDDTIWI